MTATATIREQIVNDMMIRNDERLAELRIEVAFALAVRAAMRELEGKSVTRRITGKVAEILGWSSAIIVLNSSSDSSITWSLSAWGGESNRSHLNRIIVYLGYRDSVYSPKAVNFAGWAANHCIVERTRSAIQDHEAVTREHAESIADALLAVEDAKARYREIAESSPVSLYAENALKRMRQ